ncbi:MAG: hypothetical protein KF838_12870 [Phycisphaeraceae bacterium]|nr:MAG: hypothetical protein KF838_12870 [Phycisphaeraceae bacterium]
MCNIRLPLIVLFVFVSAFARSTYSQPSGGVSGPDPVPSAAHDSLAWLGEFYTELSGSPFRMRRSSLGLVPLGSDSYDMFAFDTRDFTGTATPIGACNVVERHDVPAIDISDSEAQTYGLVSVRNWFGIFVATTNTNYSGVILALVTDINYMSSEGAPLSCSRFLPLSEHDTVEAAQDSLGYWGAPFIEDLGAISVCSGVDPNTAFGRYCKCTKDARDDAFEDALKSGGAGLGGLAVCLGGIACGPAAPLCVGGCGVLVLGSFGFYTYANIHGFNADMYTCALNLCIEDSNYPCPP